MRRHLWRLAAVIAVCIVAFAVVLSNSGETVGDALQADELESDQQPRPDVMRIEQGGAVLDGELDSLELTEPTLPASLDLEGRDLHMPDAVLEQLRQNPELWRRDTVRLPLDLEILGGRLTRKTAPHQ